MQFINLVTNLFSIAKNRTGTPGPSKEDRGTKRAGGKRALASTLDEPLLGEDETPYVAQ